MCDNVDGKESKVEEVMLKRRKYDRSKICVKCKVASGNLVLRHVVYCRSCFTPLITNKFRRTMETEADSPTKSFLIGFSGSLESSVLLDLVNITYLARQGRGKKYSSLKEGTTVAKVCYVETCGAYPNMNDRTEDARKLLEKYPGFEFVPLKLEDAFDPNWWKSVNGASTEAIEANFNDGAAQSPTSSPLTSLNSYLDSLPTTTGRSTAISTLIRLLLLHTARANKLNILLLGTSLTTFSVDLISSIAQGGGFSVREEKGENWRGEVRVVKPLMDINLKECAAWAWWNKLGVLGGGAFSERRRQGIPKLTKDFVVGLERDYPSTVFTIARTCGKLVPKANESGKSCALCERPVQKDVQDWKRRIAIRSMPSEEATTDTSPSFMDDLCYACHTTLTSGTHKGTGTTEKVLLPVWAGPNMQSTSENVLRPQIETYLLDD